jgi:multidrug resistance efflux pump
MRDELASLQKQQDSLTIISPAHGMIGSIRHQSGDLIQAGESVVELLDDDRRHLTAYIPSSAVTGLHPGSRVELMFPGRQSRIGLVASIAPHAIPADRGVVASDSQVEVTIEPAGKLWPQLPIGSRVQVKILD